MQSAPAHIDHRPFSTLGKADHGWLNANFHFSFSAYHNPARMNWGGIRVWNDDEIAAHSGFPMHGHDNMEIFTYVREGAITHRDSMGNMGRTAAGDVQVMSAGTGITHSEMNAEDELCRLFQIWIMPRTHGIAPRWDQREFTRHDPAEQSDRFNVLASGYREAGALSLNADARILGITLSAGQQITHDIAAGHGAYMVGARGRIDLSGIIMNARDGAAISGGSIEIEALDEAEILMVETLR
jgi:quercetin 2,3-dioxygenase